MELNTITPQEYYRDVIRSQLVDIFEPGQYIQSRNRSGFEDIKSRIMELIENISSIGAKKDSALDEQLNEKFLALDFGAEFDIDATKIGIADASFFINLLNQNNIINYAVEDNQLTLSTNNKRIETTNSLINMLQTSLDSAKPIRLDFDTDVTVILRLNKEGKVQAHFIPGTSEVESYLRSNIACLKQNFDEQNINYSTLSYSKYKDGNKKQKRSNK